MGPVRDQIPYLLFAWSFFLHPGLTRLIHTLLSMQFTFLTLFLLLVIGRLSLQRWRLLHGHSLPSRLPLQASEGMTIA